MGWDVPGVLVLGSSEAHGIPDALFNAGLTPVLRETVLSAVSALRRGRFAAVVVDCRHVKADALEFVLNVRDVDDRIPLFLVGAGTDLELFRHLPDRLGVTIVGKDELLRRLRPVLAK